MLRAALLCAWIIPAQPDSATPSPVAVAAPVFPPGRRPLQSLQPHNLPRPTAGC